MSVVITCCRLIKSPLLNKIMTSNVSRYYALEQRISKAETTVRNLVNEIDAMKAELFLLKDETLLSGPKNVSMLRQKRLLETSANKSLAVKIEEDKNDVPPGKKSRIAFDEENGYVVVYTDGACPNNGRRGAKAGIGVWFGDNHPLNVGKPCPGPRQTNNAAEIYAAAEACKVARENGVEKLKIYTDSKFAIDCITKWMPGWKKKNWKNSSGKDVINKDELLDLEKYANALKDVKYVHVDGHSGIKGNEAADRLAVQGAYY